MVKTLKLLFLSSLILLVSGCECYQEWQEDCREEKATKESIKEAVAMIKSGETKCVLINDGYIVANYSGRGVSPLLELYKTNQKDMDDGIVVDKVIGRAAAFIVINGDADKVYALLISEDAKELLEEHDIEVEYEKIVPRILNYKKDGLCPLEESVLNERHPKRALEKLEAKINQLNTQAK